MLRHAFQTWRVLRVTLKTDARNKASRAAIERLGARFEGVRRAHAPAQDGTVRDTAYFSIVAAGVLFPDGELVPGCLGNDQIRAFLGLPWQERRPPGRKP